MREFLTALLVLLMVVALSAANPGVAGAAPCSEHEQSTSAAAAATHSVRRVEDCDHHHCKEGKCLCPCCGAVGSATFVAPLMSLDLAPERTAAIALPRNQVRAGITIRPVTGPPKLSA